MSNKYQVIVFGKANCDKCRALNHKVDALLQKDEYKNFEKRYIDVMSEDGLVMFCDLESLNPQKIPALIMMKQQDKEYIPVNRPNNHEDDICGSFLTYQYWGLQTDYSNNDGKITSKMIEHVFEMAMGT